VIPEGFDWKAPDYRPVFQARAARLSWLRALDVEDTDERQAMAAARFAQVRAYYATAPEGIADFIEDWGITFDPGLIRRKINPYVPFLLFPKQRAFVNWLVAKVRAGENGLADKTRQMGFSWLAVSVGCALCIFEEGFVAGYGSRKEEYVDKIGNPKALFPKARLFMERLPVEFRAGYTPGKTDSFMKLTFPATGSIMAGEAGDNIGRGGTTALYIVDESAFLEHPDGVDASLGQGHGCRIDISTPNGMGNPFAQKRFDPDQSADYVFTMHWRDDPRKDDAWYAEQKRKLSAVVLAQEVDIDYTASVAGVIIPAAWIRAAVDAHLKLGVKVTGERRSAFDVADEGGDLCAVATCQGVLVEQVKEWSGAGADIHRSTQRAFSLCDENEVLSLVYDADGLGAGVRGAGRVLNELRATPAVRKPAITLLAFRGSGAVHKPEAQQEKGRKNQDYFANCKAQSWHWLKQLFYNTYRAVEEGYDPPQDQIISLSGRMPNLQKLIAELSQPTWEENTVGKMVVDKTPEGTKSPNLADAVMMLYSPARRGLLNVSQRALDAA
jgi:hypothetical protein